MSDGAHSPPAWTATAHPPARVARRLLLASVLVLVGPVARLLAQPAGPIEAAGEPLALSYAYRHFDGVTVDTVVLTARSARLVTDTLGAWTPHGEGTTATGFVLRHRHLPGVFVTICPFAGPGPNRNAEAWRDYLREVARQLGSETKTRDAGASGTAGGTPSFGSWPTREAVFVVPATPAAPGRTERHIAASDGTRGVLIMLAGPTTNADAALADFQLLLARLQRE